MYEQSPSCFVCSNTDDHVVFLKQEATHFNKCMHTHKKNLY